MSFLTKIDQSRLSVFLVPVLVVVKILRHNFLGTGNYKMARNRQNGNNLGQFESRLGKEISNGISFRSASNVTIHNI